MFLLRWCSASLRRTRCTSPRPDEGQQDTAWDDWRALRLGGGPIARPPCRTSCIACVKGASAVWKWVSIHADFFSAGPTIHPGGRGISTLCGRHKWRQYGWQLICSAGGTCSCIATSLSLKNSRLICSISGQFGHRCCRDTDTWSHPSPDDAMTRICALSIGEGIQKAPHVSSPVKPHISLTSGEISRNASSKSKFLMLPDPLRHGRRAAPAQ